MIRTTHRWPVVLAAILLVSCSQQKQPTPTDVRIHYHALLDSLDEGTPGASAARLAAFRDANARYDVADSAISELAQLESRLSGRYHLAREMAREGEFEQAELVLQDLARARGSEEGKLARRHLEFDFYFEQARWLLVRQRSEEAEEVARRLMTHELTRVQIEMVEDLLDNAGMVQSAVQLSRSQSMKSAVRQLSVLMATLYVNEGQYPSRLTLDDLAEMDPFALRYPREAIERIEGYHASRDEYSLVAVGKHGERMRLVNGTIED